MCRRCYPVISCAEPHRAGNRATNQDHPTARWPRGLRADSGDSRSRCRRFGCLTGPCGIEGSRQRGRTARSPRVSRGRVQRVYHPGNRAASRRVRASLRCSSCGLSPATFAGSGRSVLASVPDTGLYAKLTRPEMFCCLINVPRENGTRPVIVPRSNGALHRRLRRRLVQRSEGHRDALVGQPFLLLRQEGECPDVEVGVCGSAGGCGERAELLDGPDLRAEHECLTDEVQQGEDPDNRREAAVDRPGAGDERRQTHGRPG